MKHDIIQSSPVALEVKMFKNVDGRQNRFYNELLSKMTSTLSNIMSLYAR